ncbi:MAG: hypothetical protein IKK52_05005 [Alphaproteobacteria bacterium]|nr:hypothetical protein [Alphaproteobacteria bacterium]
MTVSATRKVGMSSPNRVMKTGGRSETVEDIDTNNNVLVRDENQDNSSQQQFSSKQQASFSSYEHNVSTSIEALTLSGMLEDSDDEKSSSNNRNVNVYSNNQSIVKDEDVERIGRSYLKRFYEENEPITDVNELV